MARKKPMLINEDIQDRAQELIGDLVQLSEAARGMGLEGDIIHMEEAASTMAALARDAADLSCMLQSIIRRRRRMAETEALLAAKAHVGEKDKAP